jgi:hypothetical protein
MSTQHVAKNIIMAVIIIQGTCFATSQEPLFLIESIIRSHESFLNQITDTRGNARVLANIKHGKNKKNAICDSKFYYTKQASRTDSTFLNTRNNKVTYLADNGEIFTKYKPRTTHGLIDKTGNGAFLNVWGSDLSVRVYFTLDQVLISDLLKDCIKQKYLNIHHEIVKDDIIKLVIKGEHAGIKDNVFMLFEPQKSFRLVELQYIQNTHDCTRLEHIVIDWGKRKEDLNYPRKASLKKEYISKNGSDKTSKYYEVQTQNVVTNIDIDDELFTLEGMDVEAGSVIEDVVAGVVYKYKNAIVTEKDLEILASKNIKTNDSLSRVVNYSNVGNITNEVNVHGELEIQKKIIQQPKQCQDNGIMKVLQLLLVLLLLVVVIVLGWRSIFYRREGMRSP